MYFPLQNSISQESITTLASRILHATYAYGAAEKTRKSQKGSWGRRNKKKKKKRRQKKRGQGEMPCIVSNIKNEHVPARHTTDRSRGMKVHDTEQRYTVENSRRTGADTEAREDGIQRCPMDLLLYSLLLLTAGNDNGKSCLLYSARRKRDRARLNNTGTWWLTMNAEERCEKGEMEAGRGGSEIFVFLYNVLR